MNKGGIKILIVPLVIALLAFLTFVGIPDLGIPGVEGMRFGTDIKGGVYALMYPDIPADEVTNNDLDVAVLIINNRLEQKGIYDRIVTPEIENKRVIVEIPWKPGETSFNPQETIDELGKTALLTFQRVDETKKNEKDEYLPTGDIVLQGADITDAYPIVNTGTTEYMVQLKLTDEARKKLADATEDMVDKPLAIFMDDVFISAPIVRERLDTDSPVIELSGRKSFEAQEEAVELANSIKSGALPFALVAKDLKSISPIIGEGALQVAIDAGIVAFILVAIFMVLNYRLPGLFSVISLFGLVVLQLFVLSVTGISLTLPGIGGIILSIGMGVDANVNIFERMKEELNAGRSIKAAIDVGFKRAFSAILDSNVTTLITALVLYFLGTGPVKGFAVTLILGVALSFLTAITASRIMLKSVAEFKFARNPKLFGAKEAAQ
ncbi:MAG: protein translocase subunit SecD [Eubacteriales bacterium]|nr:protein translocase subunit SecD [Eubacteriales bacterium]